MNQRVTIATIGAGQNFARYGTVKLGRKVIYEAGPYPWDAHEGARAAAVRWALAHGYDVHPADIDRAETSGHVVRPVGCPASAQESRRAATEQGGGHEGRA